MKTNDFKKILKPLIEQTVRDVLLKEGVLSQIVAEVAKGLQPTLVENTSVAKSVPADYSDMQDRAEDLEKQRKERIRKLNESAGLGTAVFENVQQVSESDSKSPLSGVHTADSGVDISGIQKLASGKWKQLAGGK
jgi:hypothetical protein